MEPTSDCKDELDVKKPRQRGTLTGLAMGPLGLIVTASAGGRFQPDHVSRLGSSLVFFDGELDPLALFQALESASPDGRIVDENILALVGRDEPVALGAAEPFDNAGFPLGFHFSPPSFCTLVTTGPGGRPRLRGVCPSISV
jgi:hypothetical protein